MQNYQVLARRYRPQRFKDILGQDTIVRTLINAIKMGRLAHAYLFSGPRGTGKTTTARIFAKAMNCHTPLPDGEPCNSCSSCKEITSGNSLDVLEIDGASHRGIEDIRQINETAGYAASNGKYKIYIIDEVHMLTKEAFNALLKTLEEPPPHVKFLFATTEPHKVLPTIISRCQRFHLNRIDLNTIKNKLKEIVKDLNVEAEDEALKIIAERSEGGLRDAESLLDQVIAFHEGPITRKTISSIFGLTEKELFFEIDQAAKEGRLAAAFEIVDKIFSEGKDLGHFLDGLIDHFRTLLILIIGGPKPDISESEAEQYNASAILYTQEKCLSIIELLLSAQQQIRFSPSPKTALESLLMKILRIHQRIPIEQILKKLTELQGMTKTSAATPPQQAKPAPTKPASITEDPTPPPREIPKVAPKKPTIEEVTGPKVAAAIKPTDQARYDTLLHFAAVELEGNLKKKDIIAWDQDS